MINIISEAIAIVSLVITVYGISPTRRPSYHTPKCPLTAKITCSVKASGQSCSNVHVPIFSNQCITGTLVAYQFNYCNLNKFQVKLDPTRSVIRSDFANYTFASWTIQSSSCVTLLYDGVLKHCNTSSFAALMLSGISPKKEHCYAFQRLSIMPKLLYPSHRPSTKPSKKPLAKPTRKPSRQPTTKPSMLPRSKHPTRKPSYRKPSRKPTVRQTTGNPSMYPTTGKTSMYPTTVQSSFLVCNMYPMQRRQQIINLLSSTKALMNVTSIYNITSPQAKALSWIVQSDGLQLCPGQADARIIQRYILSVFYFSTMGDDTWVQCGRFSLQPCNATLTIFPNDPVVQRYGNYIWLSAIDECLWGGLACNNATGNIDRIEFNSITSNKLAGNLPSEISKLSSIRYIILENCCSASVPIYNAAGYKGIRGSLPEDIGSLQSLLILKISYNYISGTIPISFYNLANLKEINFIFNNLSGLVLAPVAGKLWLKLRFFQLDYNRFSGIIPDLGKSTKLSTCTLQGNKFVGTMPLGICNLTTAVNNFSLKNLWADCNNGLPVMCSCCSRCF